MPANGDAATHLIIQLSDPHLVARVEPHFHDVDPDANLRCALAMVEESGLRPDMVLLTGDITDAGEVAAYRRARWLIDAAAASWNCPALYLPGNHDDRAAFAATVLALDPTEAARPQIQVRLVRGLRVIGLDSVVPGESRGHLADTHLEELANLLETPAECGSIVAMHHPPIRTPVPGIDAIGLDNPEDLDRVVAGSDVRMILAGHTHHVTAGMLGHIPVWIGGGCAYWSHSLAPRGRSGGVSGGHFSRIDVFRNAVSATSIPLGPHRWVYEL